MAAKRKTVTSSAVKNRYNQKTYKRFSLVLRKEDDANVIAWLESQESISSYLQKLIREDMAKHSKQ